MMSLCSIHAEGAPSLRFLQGRVTMLTTQFLSLYNPVAHAFQVPALCKVRKGRGTHCVYGASEVKSLGHRLNKNQILFCLQLGTGTGSCAGSLGSFRFSAASTENSMK